MKVAPLSAGLEHCASRRWWATVSHELGDNKVRHLLGTLAM
jgi:hypothetical protein